MQSRRQEGKERDEDQSEEAREDARKKKGLLLQHASQYWESTKWEELQILILWLYHVSSSVLWQKYINCHFGHELDERTDRTTWWEGEG